MPDQGAQAGAYSFAGFTLDVARGTLSREGRETRLRPKSYAVLRYLVEHPGRLVGKQELLDAVWGSTVVTEGSLTQCVIEIRRALGDSDQKLLRTVPRQGFLFDVTVTAGASSSPTPADSEPVQSAVEVSTERPPPRSRSVTAALIAVLLASGIAGWLIAQRHDDPTGAAIEVPPASHADPSIAVLRFLDLSPNGDQAYFADGLAEEILHLLAQSPDLRVIARSSSFAFEPGSTDIAAIADQLDVAYVLEGSVRRAGSQLRITVQLIDSSTRAHVWSQTYDREFAGVLDLQRQIAADVADRLKVTLSTVPAEAAPGSAEAQDLYLLGRHLLRRRGPGDLEAAERHLERAVQLDSNHARAWTELAGVYNIRGAEELGDPLHRLEEQRQALEHALAVDPRLADAHMRLGRYFTLKGDRVAAEAALERAREIAPDDPLVLGTLAKRAAVGAQLDEAIELARRAVAQDPLSAIYRQNLGHLQLAAGQYDAALAELQRVQWLSPRRLEVHADIALVMVLQGRPDDARRALASAPDGARKDQALALLAAPGESGASLERLEADRSAVGHFLRAEIEAYRGDVDAAFGLLREAVQAQAAGEPGVTFDLAYEVIISPFLEALREDPRWPALREELQSS